MLSCGKKCHHKRPNVIIWSLYYHEEHSLLSGSLRYHVGPNVIMWDQMLLCGNKCNHLELILSCGAIDIICKFMSSCGTTCYHVEADVPIITFPLRCMITLITTNIAFNIALWCSYYIITSIYFINYIIKDQKNLAGKQEGMQDGRNEGRQTDRQMYRKTDIQTYTVLYIRQTDRHTDRQTDRQDRQKRTTDRPTNRQTYSIWVLRKKIRSNFAILRKLATRTPVSTKRTNRVASKNHTSGRDKKKFLSDLSSRGLRGQYNEKSDQNSKKNFSVLAGLCHPRPSRQDK